MSSGQRIGYVRVSSVGQNTGRQLEGIKLDKTFEEKVSGKDVKRPQLQACLDYCRSGDTLHVHSIDRLARNLQDLQSIVDKLTRKGVKVIFHKENLTFSGEDSPMNKLLFQVMGAFSEFERNLIRERQAEGIAEAKAKGKHLGRPSKLDSSKKAEIRHRKLEEEEDVSISQLAKEYNVSRATVYNALK